MVVVGAGPAGSSAAIHLARGGARVLLADKARFPRDKPCGGGLTGRALKQIPVDPSPVVERDVDRFELRLRYGSSFARRHSEPLIRMTQRLRLDAAHIKPLRVIGFPNLALLAGIVAAAAFLDAPWRELAMLALSALSLAATSGHVRHANQFSFHPIVEVAAVFAGIFLTMIPALDILTARGAGLNRLLIQQKGPFTYWVRVGASRLDMPDLIGNTVTVTLTLGDDVFAQNITLTPTPTRRRFTKTAN